MFIDCTRCPVRGTACTDCLVTALFEVPPEHGTLGPEEHRAIEVFARAGFDVEVLDGPDGPPSAGVVPLAPASRTRSRARTRSRRRVAA